MSDLIALLIFVVILSIVAYFSGGNMRPALGVLGAGLLMILVFSLGGFVH